MFVGCAGGNARVCAISLGPLLAWDLDVTAAVVVEMVVETRGRGGQKPSSSMLELCVSAAVVS